MSDQLMKCPRCGPCAIASAEHIKSLQARIAELEKQLSETIPPHIRQQYEDIQQARIAELEGKLESARYSDAYFRNEIKRLQELVVEITAKLQDLETGSIFAEQSQIEADAEIDRLEERIAELEKQAIIWHKYPDKKPVNGRYYITYNGKNVESHFWRGGAEYWADMASSEDDIIINKVNDITHWAYLPQPPEVK